MEMRPVGLIILGTICFLVAFVVPSSQSYLFFVMALVPLILLAVGQFFLPRSKRSVKVWFNPVVINEGEEEIFLEQGTPLGRISGRVLSYSYFQQWHDFEIVTHRFWLLGCIGFLALVTMGFSLQMQADNFYRGMGIYYSLIAIWAVMVAIAKRWLWERRMLRLEGISMAPFSVAQNRHYFQIRYHFVDPEGHYRGGWFESMVCSRNDDMTIVFYDKDDPDRNVPASGLMFHKSVWKEPPVN